MAGIDMRYFTSGLLLFGIFFASPAFSDGLEQGLDDHSPERVQVPAEKIDKRLPPVIPGQSVTAGGRKHKVISTAGPVPVNPAPRAPEAARAPSNSSISSMTGGQGIAVIVDRNKEEN